MTTPPKTGTIMLHHVHRMCIKRYAMCIQRCMMLLLCAAAIDAHAASFPSENAAPEATAPEAPPDPTAPDPAEPSLAELQAAAIRAARLEPTRLDGWTRRARAAGLAPSVRVRVARTGGELRAATDYAGATRLTLDARDSWQFDISASWSLDRVVWNPEEARLAGEALRIAAHRERLITEVASLYTERRRLQIALRLRPPRDPLERATVRLRILELAAILDALTGGALTAAAGRDATHEGARVPADTDAR